MKVRTRLKRRAFGQGLVRFRWQQTTRYFVRLRPPPAEHFSTVDISDDVRAEVQEHRRRLAEDGSLLDANAFQVALSITPADVQTALDQKRFFTVEVDGELYYPAFLANTDMDRHALETVSQALGEMSGWLKWDFFVARRGSLGDKSPLELLAVGDIKGVIARARTFKDEVLD
ncbi:hypothetical protein [Paraburkholderia sp. ZP32-5]|uniref:hypothetical protein n=1 Tax=Paraburkholderia sp. ZP32-5 TaxID=2883245 RepID=UPI001F2F02CA|nr:hypothetical protein [Paraburkholderia sp. ZP32-5]